MEPTSTIIKWYEKKTKLYKKKDLDILLKYIVKTDQNIANDIEFSNDFEFNYLDLEKINCESIKVRPENIFKINLLRIIKKFKKYFTNIELDLFFESPGDIDREIKTYKCTFKHDAYIRISNNVNENKKSYDIGLEYFESIHDRIKDDDKYISSKINLDGYYIYFEKKNNYNDFIKNIIYSLFIWICALDNDKYTLSKIIYFKNYKNTKSLKMDTELFNDIISWKKNDNVNFKIFFERLRVINPDTEEIFKYKEFIEYIEENYNIIIDFIDNSETFCKYSVIIDILVKMDNSYSRKIEAYLKIYTRTMDVLIESQDELIKWVKDSNESRKLIPKYTDNFLRNHIQYYKCNDTLKKVYHELEKINF